jgi:hypothetical protein
MRDAVKHRQAITGRLLGALWMAVAVSLLAGCTVLPSERSAFPEGTSGAGVPVIETPQDTVDARPVLEEALLAMEAEADKYWYSGYIRNPMEKHLVNSMFDGVVLRPKQAYLINARIAGQPYQYYSYEGVNYLKDQDRWYPIPGNVALPFDPLAGFADWLPLMEKAVKKPDEQVLGAWSDVYEVRISGKSWIESSPSLLFEELKAVLDAGSDDLSRLLEQAIVKTTLKIGKEDRFIREYDTWIVMPLPDGGYVDQRIYVRLYRFDDPSIEAQQLPVPSRIEDWIKQYDELDSNGVIVE